MVGFSSEAITHAHEAADYVGMGDADALVTHAEGRFNMLLPPSRIHRVLTWMPGLQNEGMRFGKAGHADVAILHAKTTIMHLMEI